MGFEMVHFERKPRINYYSEGKDFSFVAFEQLQMGLLED